MLYSLMDIVINILNIIILIKGCSFSLYEIKKNNNKSGGITTIIISVLVFILTLYIIWIK